MRSLALFCAALTLGAQNPLPSSLTFDPCPPESQGARPLQMNLPLRIKVDGPSLMKALVPEGAVSAEDVAALKEAIQALLDTQRTHAAYEMTVRPMRTGTLRREEILALKEKGAPLAQQRGNAYNTFLGALRRVSCVPDTLRRDLENRLLNPPSGEPYSEMASVLKATLQSFESRLSQKPVPYRLALTADWTGMDGRPRALHLDGYDAIATGGARSYGRLDLSLDSRFQAGWKAAADLGQWGLNQGPEERKKVVAVLQELDVALKASRDEAQAALQNLLEAWQAAGSPPEQLKALQTRWEAWVSATRDLSPSPDLVSRLQALAAQAEQLVKDTELGLIQAKSKVMELPQATQKALAPALAKAKSALEAASNALRSQYLEAVGQLKQIVQTADALWADVDSTSRRAKALLGDTGRLNDLDTVLDLRTVQGTRPETGDLIQVKAELTREENGQTVSVARHTQDFRTELYGFYFDAAQAALIATRPTQASSKATRQLMPAMVVNCRLGIRGWDSFNHKLGLGFGLSLALLDFDPAQSTELGVAANITLFRNFLHIGYGQNWMTKDRYAYFGLNPLVLGRLLGWTR